MLKHSDSLPLRAFLPFALFLAGFSCSKNTDMPVPAMDAHVAVDMTAPKPPHDLRSPPDLTAPPHDLMTANRCIGKLGQRACAADGQSAGTCMATDGGPGFQPDRTCQGDGCDAPTGYCNAPKDHVGCANDTPCNSDLGQRTCQVFTNIFGLTRQYCAPPPGSLGKLQICVQDSDCRWNFCYSYNQAMRCMQPCQGDNDCDGSPGSCAPAMPTVEGQYTTIFVCTR